MNTVSTLWLGEFSVCSINQNDTTLKYNEFSYKNVVKNILKMKTTKAYTVQKNTPIKSQENKLSGGETEWSSVYQKKKKHFGTRYFNH